MAAASALHCVNARTDLNPDVPLASLDMVHSFDYHRTYDPDPSNARWHMDRNDKHSPGDDQYRAGGVVLNIRLDPAYHQDRRNEVWSLAACDPTHCNICQPGIVGGTSPTGDLPFVHSRHLFSLDQTLHYRLPLNELPIELDPNAGVSAYERKLVTFEEPVGTAMPLIKVVMVAACIPTSCTGCLSAPRPAAPMSASTSPPTPVAIKVSSLRSARFRGGVTDMPDALEESVSEDGDEHEAEVKEDEDEEEQEQAGDDEEEAKEEWNCEGFMDSKYDEKEDVCSYLVRWEGDYADTWEPIENLLPGLPGWFRDYHEDYPNALRPSQALAGIHGIEHLMNRELEPPKPKRRRTLRRR